MTRKIAYRPRICEICHRRIEHASTGRPRLTCSDRCRQIKRRRYDYKGWIDKRKREQKRNRAEKQIRKWEKQLGLDFNTIPGYHFDPYGMSLRDRLMIYLPRGWRVVECWTCKRPFILDGQSSGTCSRKCREVRYKYGKALADNFYSNPRPMPREITAWIREERRLGLCAHCGDPFIPTRSNRKYCAERCRKAAYKHRNPGWRCYECGAVCPGRQKYCSDRCYMRHHRSTKKFCMRCHKMIQPGTEVYPNDDTRMPRTVVTPKRDYSAFCSGRCRDRLGWSPLRKVCEACGEGYYPTQASNQQRQKYCSTVCKERIKEERRLERKPKRFCVCCHAELGFKQQKYCAVCTQVAVKDYERRRTERRRGLAIGIPVRLPVRELELVGD